MSLTRDEILAAQALPGWQWVEGMVTSADLNPDEEPPPPVIVYERGYPFDQQTVYAVSVGLLPGAPHNFTADDPLYYVDPTNPATGGCLLALLGADAADEDWSPGYVLMKVTDMVYEHQQCSLGEACIRVALARGRWGV